MKILERGDTEFKKAMEVEVSTLLFPTFSSECRVSAGVDITAQFSVNFAIFK